MRGTIHQAYFLPWLGYFSKLAFSDVFVLLDNVQFRKRHYFDRTRYVNMHGEVAWLSLPVGDHCGVPCTQVHIQNSEGRQCTNKIIRTLRESYAKARHYEREWYDIESILQACLSRNTSLVTINLSLIRELLTFIGIPAPEIVLASSLTARSDDPSERIRAICMEVGIDTLVVGSGSSLRIHDWRLITDNGVNVYVQDYLNRHPVYDQLRRRRAGFQRGLSTIDAILNAGRPATKQFIVDSAQTPTPVLRSRVEQKGTQYEDH